MSLWYITFTFLIFLAIPLLISIVFTINYVFNNRVKTNKISSWRFLVNYLFLALFLFALWYFYSTDFVLGNAYDSIPAFESVDVPGDNVGERLNINMINLLWIYPVLVTVFFGNKYGGTITATFVVLLLTSYGFSIQSSLDEIDNILNALFSNPYELFELMLAIVAITCVFIFEQTSTTNMTRRFYITLIFSTSFYAVAAFTFIVIPSLISGGEIDPSLTGSSKLPLFTILIFNPLFMFTCGIGSYHIVKLVTNFFENASTLSEFNSFTSKSFYRLGVFNKSIYSYISQYHISQAVVLTLSFNTGSKLINSPYKENILAKLSNDLLFHFDTIFFNIDNRHYGMFVNSDVFFMNQKSATDISHELDFFFWNRFGHLLDKDISVAFTIYGQDSNDMNELLAQNKFTLENIEKTENYVAIKKFNQHEKEIINSKSFEASKVFKKFPFKDMVVKYNTYPTKLEQVPNIYLPIGMSHGEREVTPFNAVYQMYNDVLLGPLFLRYVGNIIINQRDPGIYLIPYLAHTLINDIEIGVVSAKLGSHASDTSKHILLVDKLEYDAMPKDEQHIIKLYSSKYKIKIIVFNFKLIKQRIDANVVKNLIKRSINDTLFYIIQ